MVSHNHMTKYNDPLKDDFRNFLFVVWRHLGLPSPTPVQYDIAYYLQHGPQRAVIEAFRGVGKSWITAAFVVWLLYRNPKLNILVVSASKDRSDAFSTFCKRLILDIPILEGLRPEPSADLRWSNVAFDVAGAGASQSPSVKSVGITGQMTGSRADVIIADDVETLSNSLTQTMRDRIAETVKEFDAILKPLEQSRIIYLGTPQLEMSLYNELPNRGYEVRIWPAQVPPNPDKYLGRLAPMIQRMIDEGKPAGTLVDPIRFSEVDLMKRKASYGRTGYALQFMMDTSLSDAERFPLKLRDLIVYAAPPHDAPIKLVWGNDPDKVAKDLASTGLAGDRWYHPIFKASEVAPYAGAAMFIDPSGSGADETSYTVIKQLHGMLFLVAAGGFRDGFGEPTLKALATIGLEHKVNIVLIEKNFGDGMFAKLLEPVFAKIHPVTIEEVRHSVQKERRICDTLEPVMNQHRLIVDPRVIEEDLRVEDPTRSLFYQMTRITREKGALKHDDRLDALSGNVAYWVEHMAQDVEQAEERFRQEQREQEIERWMAEFGGHVPQTTWHQGRPLH